MTPAPPDHPCLAKVLEQEVRSQARDFAAVNLVLARCTDFSHLGWRPTEQEVDAEYERLFGGEAA